MEQVPLIAQKRTVLGRKVKKLRGEGLIPAHVFGHKVKTIHVQVNANEFAKVFEKVGETGIIDLTINGLTSDLSAKASASVEAKAKEVEKKPVLVRNVQTHPVSDQTLHIDFYQVNLAEKVKVNVPLEIIGEAPAVEKKIGLLLTPVTELEIEALPQDIPEKIEIDVSQFQNVGDEVKIKDLKVDKSKIEVHADEELVVAQIGELITKEQQELEAQIEAEQAEAAAEEKAPEAEAAEAKSDLAESAEGEGKEKTEEAKPAEEVKQKPQEEKPQE